MVETWFCEKCRMTFPIGLQPRGERTWCAVPNCDVRFSHGANRAKGPATVSISPLDVPEPKETLDEELARLRSEVRVLRQEIQSRKEVQNWDADAEVARLLKLVSRLDMEANDYYEQLRAKYNV